VDKLVSEGFLLPEDGAKLKEQKFE
jgi:hypothetical protein